MHHANIKKTIHTYRVDIFTVNSMNKFYKLSSCVSIRIATHPKLKKIVEWQPGCYFTLYKNTVITRVVNFTLPHVRVISYAKSVILPSQIFGQRHVVITDSMWGWFPMTTTIPNFVIIYHMDWKLKEGHTHTHTENGDIINLLWSF